jgi:hypothetical protein
VRYLGIEVDDAIEIAEKIEILSAVTVPPRPDTIGVVIRGDDREIRNVGFCILTAFVAAVCNETDDDPAHLNNQINAAGLRDYPPVLECKRNLMRWVKSPA